MSRRLAKVEIHNIKAIEHLEFAAGALTILKGKNGVGKSSALDAISSIFEGGHDPALIRGWDKDKPADKAYCKLTLDDGTVLLKTIKPGRSDLSITTKDGGEIKPPMKFVERLAKSFKFNPAQFITMAGKERAAALLEAMPVVFSGKEVSDAAGEPGLLPDSEPVTLQRLAEIRQGRYSKRTEVKRDWEEKAGFIFEAERNIPKMDADVSGLVTMLRGQLQSAKADLAEERAKIEERKVALQGAITTNFHAKLTALQEEFNRTVRALEQEVRDNCAVHDREAAEQLAAVNADSATRIEELTATLAGAEAKLAEQQRAAGMIAQLQKTKQAAQELGARHGHLDRAVQGLDQLKNSKLAVLPVPGVEVREIETGKSRNPEVFVEGVEWCHVNKSRQAKVAMAIAALNLGELPLMVLDESEVLDSESMDALAAAAKSAGLQVIAARVDDNAVTLTAE